MTAPARTSHDGLVLPAIGFGTYKLTGDEGADAVASAIRAGYRLLDSAVNYGNEATVADGMRRSGVDRDELIVTSKLPGRFHARTDASRCIEQSLRDMGLERIDLYLIHWPNPSVDRYVEAWEALIDARERGLVGAIGTSNFLPEHLKRLERETGVLPAVNQIELHPRVPQLERAAWNAEHGIITQGWSPLGRPKGIVDDELVRRIAAARDATPSQIVLGWAIARGVIPIPKASSPERQRENLESVDVAARLDGADLEAISGLAWPADHENPMDPASHEEP